MRFIIICTTDSQTYGEYDTEDKAAIRAKLQAERNPGREYVIAQILKSFQFVPTGYEMVEK